MACETVDSSRTYCADRARQARLLGLHSLLVEEKVIDNGGVVVCEVKLVFAGGLDYAATNGHRNTSCRVYSPLPTTGRSTLITSCQQVIPIGDREDQVLIAAF
jgi:hypothetical protein